MSSAALWHRPWRSEFRASLSPKEPSGELQSSDAPLVQFESTVSRLLNHRAGVPGDWGGLQMVSLGFLESQPGCITQRQFLALGEKKLGSGRSKRLALMLMKSDFSRLECWNENRCLEGTATEY